MYTGRAETCPENTGYVSEPDQYTCTRNITSNTNKIGKTDATAVKCLIFILLPSKNINKCLLGLPHTHKVATNGASFALAAMKFANFRFTIALKITF